MVLVVTIVILIILATISINAVLGDKGLIKKAQQAKDMYEQSRIEEEEAMNQLMQEYENAMAEPPKPTGPEMPSTWDKTKVTAIDDGKGNPVPLPNGFYYVGGDIDTGIVISDKPGDTMDASGTSMGNQFVWIPVASEADLERTEFDSNGQPTTGLDTTVWTEPYGSGHGAEASAYNVMRTQVLKYGGFYIGRFEAGINSTNLRTGTTTAQTVVSKKGVAPYNYVPWGKSMDDPSEIEGKSGAVYLANNMYTASTSVTSTLCYGCQWDAMCRYIGDSQRTIPTKSNPGLTGSVSTDISKNIYDLAGNCFEWTMEAYTTIVRALRGGVCSIDNPVSTRDTSAPTYCNDGYAFRCTLYVK